MATVAINGSKCVGILACQMLALKYEEVAKKIKKFKDDMTKKP